MKRITDPTFRYVRAAETDIRKTFRRIREQQSKNATEAKAKVATIPQLRKINR